MGSKQKGIEKPRPDVEALRWSRFKEMIPAVSHIHCDQFDVGSATLVISDANLKASFLYIQNFISLMSPLRSPSSDSK
jgi:hypothetical protein